MLQSELGHGVVLCHLDQVVNGMTFSVICQQHYLLGTFMVINPISNQYFHRRVLFDQDKIPIWIFNPLHIVARSYFRLDTMSTRKAVVHKSKGVAQVDSNVPFPTLRDDYIIVKTKAVALNPTDWKAIETRSFPGAIAGCDYSGIVEEVGKAVTNDLKVGDRVAGLIRGGKAVKND